MAKKKIGLLGLGVIASSFITNFNNSKLINYADIDKILVQDLGKDRNIDISADLLTTNPDDILINEDIDIVIELIGGEEQALEYTIKALNHQKHVITANKALVAQYINELVSIAIQNGVSFSYEASVGGGLPIISLLMNSLAHNKMISFTGICNGTSNFILSMMQEHKIEFTSALQQAKALGFAESDVKLDVDGYDSAFKASILSSLCFKHYNKYTHVNREGISKITLLDIEQAKSFGYSIKPVVYGSKKNNKIQVATFPGLVPINSIISHIDGVDNIVSINSDLLGTSNYIAPGAGGDPTSSSLLADLSRVLFNNFAVDSNFYNTFNQEYEYSELTDSKFKYYMNIKIDNSKPPNIMEFILDFQNAANSNDTTLLKFNQFNNHTENLYHVVILTDYIDHNKLSEFIAGLNSKYNILEYNTLRALDV